MRMSPPLHLMERLMRTSMWGNPCMYAPVCGTISRDMATAMSMPMFETESLFS